MSNIIDIAPWYAVIPARSDLDQGTGLGTSVACHQDGTTHWDHPRWDQGIHGFNFMAQLCRTTPENALWIVPGSHKLGKIDIKARAEAHGSDRLPDAVPVLRGCARGTVSA